MEFKDILVPVLSIVIAIILFKLSTHKKIKQQRPDRLSETFAFTEGFKLWLQLPEYRPWNDPDDCPMYREWPKALRNAFKQGYDTAQATWLLGIDPRECYKAIMVIETPVSISSSLIIELESILKKRCAIDLHVLMHNYREDLRRKGLRANVKSHAITD